jgi:hypothetical protein
VRALEGGSRSLSSLLKPKLQAGQHGIAYAGLFRVFTHGYYTPRNVPVGDHANWIQALVAFDYRNLAAIVPDHHLGCFLNSVFRRAASKMGNHNVFALLH